VTLEEYTQFVVRTCGATDDKDRFILAALGIAGEAGEVADLAKKLLSHGYQEGHAVKFREELGDLLWYIALMCDILGFPLENVLAANVEKLRKRYPEGWSVERSINRGE